MTAVRSRADPGGEAVEARVASLPWERVAEELDGFGNAVLERLLTAPACADLAARYRWNEAMEPGRDFSGGEFVLTEQRPRIQSRAEVVPLRQGDAVAFAVHHRPVRGTREVYQVKLRHRVSRIRSGRRHTAGIIFHDGE